MVAVFFSAFSRTSAENELASRGPLPLTVSHISSIAGLCIYHSLSQVCLSHHGLLVSFHFISA